MPVVEQRPRRPMSGTIIAEGLHKQYRVKTRDPGLRGALAALLKPRYRDVQAVQDVSFRIESGEMVAFLGPNGAGKTTTIKILSGLLHPDGGRAEVAGFEPWSGGPPFKQRIALVLGNKQQLIWDLPPEETFQLNRAIYAIPEPDYRARLDELVELLFLSDLLDKPVRQLSQGERMKCELAAALLHGPEVLFLDEPTLGLDVAAQDAIRGFLRDYRERSGATILLTSHYMGDVSALASRVLIINKGRLLYDGALRELVVRTNRRKRIELVLGNGNVARADLEAYGTLCRFEPPYAALEVPREQAPEISARLLAAIPVADLSIHEPPIEDVIREVFAEQESAAAAELGAAQAPPESERT
jgi:ABC-2 type transport system ATP-binding protein